MKNKNQTLASRYYSDNELSCLDTMRIPRHVAIVMDGNRRWAKGRGLLGGEGHSQGVSNLFTIVNAAADLGINTLTVYGFSTENWNRSAAEVALIMGLCERSLKKKCPQMVAEGVRLFTIGDLTRLPKGLQKEIQKTKEATKAGNTINLVLALNYGARDEMRRALQRICLDFSSEKFKKEQITEELIGAYLDTAPFQDPELFIRTSGEMRLSNFLLWQLAYAEVYVTDVLWPDFTPKELLKGVRAYQQRERRYGK